MPSINAGSVEMQILFCALVLGLIQLVLAIVVSVLGRGTPWAAGPRDEAPPTLGKFSGRIERAWQNFIETFPLFARRSPACPSARQEHAHICTWDANLHLGKTSLCSGLCDRDPVCPHADLDGVDHRHRDGAARHVAGHVSVRVDALLSADTCPN